jgi:hypothetical protein
MRVTKNVLPPPGFRDSVLFSSLGQFLREKWRSSGT